MYSRVPQKGFPFPLSYRRAQKREGQNAYVNSLRLYIFLVGSKKKLKIAFSLTFFA